MSAPGKPRWRRVAITFGFLVPVVALVVYSSFQVSQWECDLCITFDGQQACVKVTGATEVEGRRTAMDTACGQLASGVTDTLRCGRTPPDRVQCRPL